MAFPFSITLTFKTNIDCSVKNELQAFEVIGKYLYSKDIHDFFITGNTLSCNPFFVSRRHVFSGINKSEFRLTDDGGKLLLSYKFYLVQLFIIAFAAGVFFGGVSGKLWLGASIFLLLYIVNFIGCYLRQKDVINDLVYNIDMTV